MKKINVIKVTDYDFDNKGDFKEYYEFARTGIVIDDDHLDITTNHEGFTLNVISYKELHAE